MDVWTYSDFVTSRSEYKSVRLVSKVYQRPRNIAMSGVRGYDCRKPSVARPPNRFHCRSHNGTIDDDFHRIAARI